MAVDADLAHQLGTLMTPPLIMDWKMLTNLLLQVALSRKKEVVDRCFFIDSVNHISEIC